MLGARGPSSSTGSGYHVANLGPRGTTQVTPGDTLWILVRPTVALSASFPPYVLVDDDRRRCHDVHHRSGCSMQRRSTSPCYTMKDTDRWA
ncbi:hypothetical protein Aglo01_40990 [Actinokineospora globicatena]|nr:hypothetical protein Aglo01_40990 [Actinokineospora globicatena]GLW85972.1 hypothetical protein Aglo02_36120 [Actinokineospora globicatena]